MNKKILGCFAALFLLTTAFPAEFKVDSLLVKAASDLKHAPAIVARVAVKNPKFLVEIVSATVEAFPDQAVGIIRALLLALPDQADGIVQAAILAQPKMSVQIAAAAVAALPDQAADIVKTAEAAAPADLRREVAGTVPTALADHARSSPVPPSFPVQPVRPDAVSPSH